MITNLTSTMAAKRPQLTNTTPELMAPAYNNMAAMSFPAPVVVHEPYLQSVTVYQQLQPFPGDDDMSKYGRRHVDPSLGILSAERYDDGRTAARSGARTQIMGQQQSSNVVFDTNQARSHQNTQIVERAGGDRRRKKQKLSDEEEGEDDASKKARGRPRLDTKDETAADRRRTQIRMAQRAYRNRKETTISSLEKQVRDLRGANEEMSNIFLNLHDFALQRGILDREREFSSQLKSSTERFLALAKSIALDESAKEDDANSTDGRKETHSPEPARGRRSRQNAEMPASQLENSMLMEPQPTNIWGYQVVREDEKDQESPKNQVDTDLPNLESFMNMPLQHGQHQIISRATPYNASFSFETDFDYLQQFRAEIPDIFETYEKNVTFQDTLPLPKTLSQHERTFGRYLNRAALEKGIQLIKNRNASPARLHRAFGFCLRFETREQIEIRLNDCIEAGIKDPLFHWKAPFVHLGGAGTYYPLNEDISGNLMPKFRSGMSMGPFSAAVTETRDTAMLNEFRMKEPGFEGPWFDSNDVENYLRGLGIEIPSNAEFITVNLDTISLRNSSSSISQSEESALNNSNSPPTTPSSPDMRFSHLLSDSNAYNTSVDVNMLTEASNDPSIIGFTAQFDDWGSSFPLQNTEKPALDLLDLSGPIFNSMGNSSINIASEIAFTNERNITISVNTLVEEIISQTVCLGRASGFRPFDVDSAVHRTIGKAMEMLL